MIQRRHGARFPLEPFAELGIGNLDGDVAAQTRIMRLVHLAHPARAHFVRAEFVAWLERHL